MDRCNQKPNAKASKVEKGLSADYTTVPSIEIPVYTSHAHLQQRKSLKAMLALPSTTINFAHMIQHDTISVTCVAVDAAVPRTVILGDR